MSNSSDNIYNKVRVEADGPDGSKKRVVRYTPITAADVDLAGITQLANPSADVNASNWTDQLGGTGAIFARDTGIFSSSPGAFKFTAGTPLPIGHVISDTVTQVLGQGRRYALVLAVRLSSAHTNPTAIIKVLTGAGVQLAAAQVVTALPLDGALQIAADTWVPLLVDFVPSVDTPNYKVDLVAQGNLNAQPIAYFDTFQFGRAKPTLLDRRDDVRSYVLGAPAPMSIGGMQRVGDLFLNAHKTQPLKGTVEIVGQGGARRVLGGQAIHPGHLLRYVNERIRLAHRTDPDTGGQGRDGEIISVSYDHDTRTATVEVDDTRTDFETLLTRYAAVAGS